MSDRNDLQARTRARLVARYHTALVSGDLATLELLLLQATKDQQLQEQLLDIHGVSTTVAQPVLDFKDHQVMKNTIGTTNSQPEIINHSQVLPPPRRAKRAGWYSILVAAVLFCLVGVGFFALHTWQSTLGTSNPKANPTPTIQVKTVTSLCTVASPNLSTASTNKPKLTDISGSSANDIWAVGRQQNGQELLIEHWDGKSWSFVSSPTINDPTAIVNSEGVKVASLSPTNAWLVGISSTTDKHALAEHWDGKTWNIVSLPLPTNTTDATVTAITAITAITANDIWVAGDTASSNGQTAPTPVVEHWNGQNWQIVTSPAFPQYGDVTAMTASSAHDLWISALQITPATGTTATPTPGVTPTPTNTPTGTTAIFLRWDGSQWHQSVNPLSVSVGVIFSLSADASNDVWATGQPAQMGTTPPIEHWNGTGWSVVNNIDVSPPDLKLSGALLNHVLALAPDNVWAVGSGWVTIDGSAGTPNTHYTQVIEHWNGLQWQLLSNTTKGDAGYLNSISSIAGTIWVVGIAYQGDQQIRQPLIEKGC